MESTFDLGADTALPELGAAVPDARLGEPATHTLKAVYYDTADLRLAARRVTLRRRTGGTDAGWHAKRPAERGRREIQVPLGRSTGVVPAALRAELAAITRGRALQPIARVRTERTEYPVLAPDGTVLALVADDRVTSEVLGEDLLSQQWREVEVELVEGDDEVLVALAGALEAGGATPAVVGSKLARTLGERLPAVPAPGRGAGALITAYLRAQRDAIVANEPGVRSGDPDAVHDMRVAIRRLRSTLRTFRPVLDDAASEPLRAELKWLANLLGPVRDSDVMTTRLTEAVGELPAELILGPVDEQLAGYLAADAGPARKQLDRELAGGRFFALLDAVDEQVDTPVRAGARKLRRLAAAALDRADRELAEGDPDRVPPATRRLPTPEPEREARLHHARRLYKRARYAAEALAPLDPKPARKLVRRLTALQDVLGTHQDSVVTGELLLRLAARAERDGASGFTYGVLAVEQRLAGAAVLHGLPAAARRAAAGKVRDWLAD
ncbi:CYTH and CHAD domain-containing protein [Pilimelia anulata]|uniref:CYTH and CHAD domain-containing protein n=1 Tax=Pilimelia anulata TaxID=53371 RepID=UPI00166EFAAD|nr:CYTH and CHAD domain-containing protein [Pilimelia anulata]